MTEDEMVSYLPVYWGTNTVVLRISIALKYVKQRKIEKKNRGNI